MESVKKGICFPDKIVSASVMPILLSPNRILMIPYFPVTKKKNGSMEVKVKGSSNASEMVSSLAR